MKNDTLLWLKYADENLKSSKILAESGLFNPSLQNVQQAVEKALKALITENSIHLIKTNSIGELKNVLFNQKIDCGLSNEDCEFLDSVYLPTKYPVSSVLPYFEPDWEICNSGIEIAERIFYNVKGQVDRPQK